jgi:hypothetical protein
MGFSFIDEKTGRAALLAVIIGLFAFVVVV